MADTSRTRNMIGTDTVIHETVTGTEKAMDIVDIVKTIENTRKGIYIIMVRRLLVRLSCLFLLAFSRRINTDC
jgi:hypothetical protein